MRYSLLLGSGLLSLFTAAQVPNYVPTTGLVGWWPFTGNANDASGNGNNGAVNGAQLTADRFGEQNAAYAFDGTSDNIFINPMSSLTTAGNSGVTISCWFNTNSLSAINSDIFDLRSTNNSSLQFLVNNLGAGIIQVQNFDAPISGGFPPFGALQPIPVNVWKHLLLTQDNSTNETRIYIDGQLANTLLFPEVPLTNPKLTIGSRNDNVGSQCCFASGFIDDFGIWDRPLDQNEITALFNAQVSPCLSSTPVSFSGLNSSYVVNDPAANLVGLPAGGLFIGDGVIGNTFNPSVAGVGSHGISYVFVDEDGCVGSAALCTTVELNVGGEEGMGLEGGVRVFPNPNHGQFTLQLDLSGLVALQVFDARGRTVHNEVFQAAGDGTQRTLDLSSVAAGTYMLLIQHGSSTVTQQVVVE